MKKMIFLFVIFAFSANISARNFIAEEIYKIVGIQNEISYDVFEAAYEAYDKYAENQEFLTIIDYGKASVKKRMYVINMTSFEVEYHIRVTHGKNSGSNYATSFSNKDGSNKTSLGVYKTGGWHNGQKYKKALKLHGLSKGLNDNAFKRAIIMHASKFARASSIAKRYGEKEARLGRSLGCPAIPPEVANEVIKKLMGGSIIYAVGPNGMISNA